MEDDQLGRQRRGVRPADLIRAPLALTPASQAVPPTPIVLFQRFTWDEMQRRRAENLCFNCNDRFTAGNKSHRPLILILEGCGSSNSLLGENITEQVGIMMGIGGFRRSATTTGEYKSSVYNR